MVYVHPMHLRYRIPWRGLALVVLAIAALVTLNYSYQRLSLPSAAAGEPVPSTDIQRLQQADPIAAQSPKSAQSEGDEHRYDGFADILDPLPAQF